MLTIGARLMEKIKWNDDRCRRRYVTNSAFYDLPSNMQPAPDYKPTFTLKPVDTDGYYSMERLFLEHYQDPTEFSFVEDVFEGDVEHWEVFKNAEFTGTLYKRWKKMALARLQSEAMLKIVATAYDDNNKNNFNALKYLVDLDKKTEKSKTRGRPKKEVIEEPVDSQALLDDIARLKA